MNSRGWSIVPDQSQSLRCGGRWVLPSARRHREMLARPGKKGRSLCAAEKGHSGSLDKSSTEGPKGSPPHKTFLSPKRPRWGVVVNTGSPPSEAARTKLVADGECASSSDDDGPDASILNEAWSRGRWLFGLLVLQSLSSVVLDSYKGLLKDHFVVTLFLTTLVGAGGNAGNQSSIKVIRGLATGKICPNSADMWKTLGQQASVGTFLAAGLSVGGFARVYLTNGSALNSFAIGVSLFCIVLASVVAGTGLPFALTTIGVDPANAGTSIQVIMDISGTFITCAMCNIILNQLASSLGVS